ncbi:leucine-rich repeat transmembrane neuronal 4 [Brachionus plicatilis]|uniref:Leucine-rich repeat transmembrane neuronal 4 n=1 Tax=Brachionus plicatilis TaxID=10195 RepID=A0A3M7QGX7_BRAPC|nr:leucine-rich repeat transmembrane neuronal 4 [Brachionus plicatilis]
MKISIEKSCYMIFEKETKVKIYLDLKINNKEKVKFLGITLDSKLTYSPMVDELKEQTNIKKIQVTQNSAVRSILKLKYDTPSNIIHQEAFNKLNLLTISNCLFELRERYVRAGLSHSVPLVIRLVEKYREGFESRYIEYPTPLCNCYLDELESYLLVKYSIDLWNQLTTLELNSEHFRHLNELHLMCHQLTIIANCFGSVLNCQNLQELHLQSNCIHELETNCFKDLFKLKKLNLSKNNLKSISNCLNGLVNLDFNCIKILDLNSLIDCQNLLEFKAANNTIRKVILDVLVRKIMVLDLKWNYVDMFSQETIRFMPSLKRLDLSFNKKFT